MTAYIVEFWAMQVHQVTSLDKPRQTDCASVEEAIFLERRFHSVGWPARAVSINQTREYPSAGIKDKS